MINPKHHNEWYGTPYPFGVDPVWQVLNTGWSYSNCIFSGHNYFILEMNPFLMSKNLRFKILSGGLYQHTHWVLIIQIRKDLAPTLKDGCWESGVLDGSFVVSLYKSMNVTTSILSVQKRFYIFVNRYFVILNHVSTLFIVRKTLCVCCQKEILFQWWEVSKS